MACRQKTEGVVCGAAEWSAGLCEQHFKYRFPITYARMIREVKCDKCLGTGQYPNKQTQFMETCEVCNGRGIIDPGHQT